MLTPAQVKNHRFDLTGRGHYRADDVDRFFDEVYESYSQMFKENGDLVRKIGLLADKVEEYRKDEDNIRAALLTAQRMADKIVKEAKESVDGKLADANRTAQNLIDEARQKANAMLEEAKYSAHEASEQAQAQAQQVMASARAQAEEEATKITEDARNQLEEMDHEIAQKSIELKELNERVVAFKENVTAACAGVSALLDKITVQAQAELEEKVAASVRSLAEKTDIPTPPTPVEQPHPEPEQQPEPENYSAEEPVSSVVPESKRDEVQVEIDPSVVDDAFSISHQSTPKAEGAEVPQRNEPEHGFKLNLEDLDKTSDFGGQQLKFGDSYDVFDDDDDDDDAEDDHSTRSFLNNLFKK